MSTKIYNGFRIPHIDLFELMDQLKVLQVKLEALRLKKLSEKVAMMTCKFIDMNKAGIPLNESIVSEFKIDGSFCPFMKVNNFVRRETENMKKTGIRNPEFDFEFDVSLFTTKDWVLMITFFDNKFGYDKIWNELPNLEEYGYWNNTDRLDDVTDEEWDERGKLWDSVLGNSAVAQNSFTFEFLSKSIPYILVDDILNHMPTVEKRVNSVCNRLELFQEHCSDREFEHVYDLFKASHEWSQNEGKIIVDAEKERIRSLIDVDITKEMLLEDVNVT